MADISIYGRLVNQTDGTIVGANQVKDDALQKNQQQINSEFNTKLNSINSIFELVTDLPTSNIKANRIYLKLSGSQGTNNKYAEYIYTGNTTQAYDASKWEKLGEISASVDLSGYATKTEVNGLKSSLDGKVDKNSYLRATELTNQDLNNYGVNNQGFYFGKASNTCANKPSNTKAFFLQVFQDGDGMAKQVCYQQGSFNIWQRAYTGSSWSVWQGLNDYNMLFNKPTIPSAYTLPIANSLILGGVKVGSGLKINDQGVLSTDLSDNVNWFTITNKPDYFVSTLKESTAGTGNDAKTQIKSTTIDTTSGDDAYVEAVFAESLTITELAAICK